MNGVEYLHGINIVHRDVKTENVLISNGVHIIADFGFAVKMTTPEVRGPVGSLQYMAPEVVCDSWYNHKVDLWYV